jgi:hypothetical protein
VPFVVVPTVDEDYWQQLTPPRLWITPPVQAVSDSDEHSIGNLHANVVVDEDFPGPLPQPIQWPAKTRLDPWLYEQSDWWGGALGQVIEEINATLTIVLAVNSTLTMVQAINDDVVI